MKVRKCIINIGGKESRLVFKKSAGKSQEEPDYDWQSLGYEKCLVCTLNRDTHVSCPIALDLAGVAELFSNVYSYERTLITLFFDEFEMSYSADAQNICSDLITHITVSSDCPVFTKYRPFAKSSYLFREADDIFMQFIIAFSIHKFATAERMPEKCEILNELYMMGEVFEKLQKRLTTYLVKDTNSNALVKFMHIRLLFQDHLDEFLEELRNNLL
jgi:hypothetical protein